MNYNKPELIERLAAEYVLGTLRGRARSRFERLMSEAFQIRLAVWSWEAQINPLGESLKTTVPPGQLWRDISVRLGFEKRRPAGLRLWLGIGATAIAATLVMALLFSQALPQQTFNPNQVAVVSDAEAEPQWLLSFDLEQNRLNVQALNVQAAAAQNDFELWVLPATGNPRSLGLLPVATNNQRHGLSHAVVEVLRDAESLAVSLEPVGGSPTGLPTGPVLYQTTMIRL